MTNQFELKQKLNDIIADDDNKAVKWTKTIENLLKFVSIKIQLSTSPDSVQ